MEDVLYLVLYLYLYCIMTSVKKESVSVPERVSRVEDVVYPYCQQQQKTVTIRSYSAADADCENSMIEDFPLCHGLPPPEGEPHTTGCFFTLGLP